MKNEQLKVNIQSQLDSPFYKASDAYREEIKMEQLYKAAEKYPKPFDPKDFTPEQLIQHAMQENYDQQNYIYGLYEKIKEMQTTIEYLDKQLIDQTSNTFYWYTKCQQLRQAKK